MANSNSSLCATISRTENLKVKDTFLQSADIVSRCAKLFTVA